MAPLTNFYFQAHGLGVSSGVGDGQRVGGCFCGSYIDTAGVGGPDGIGLRLKFDGFGVGHAVAELDRLAATDLSGSGVKILDGEFFSAHLLEGDAILLLLFLGFCLFGAFFKVAVFG